MSELAIRVGGISKQYQIGSERERYKTLRDTMAGAAAAPFHAARWLFRRSNNRSAPHNTIWALRDVSFEIRRGEVVGIIGRNGAGKSTLLKILSRITEPTCGEAEIRGRIGSLLEVGTGFHPELTGRENIYLNGAILGMRRAEIEQKFDEIVAFAEVEKFIDTAVKHYSSGMYLRLAFAVAAHLEPEILLVDEVLAVGDIAFQKKCLGKMEDVAAHGRTVLFVSHNLGAIKELCQTAVVLNNGELEFRGPVVEGLAHYTRSIRHDEAPSNGSGWRVVRINGEPSGLAASSPGGEPFHAEAWLDLTDDFSHANIYCIINDSVGDIVVHQRVDSRSLAGGDLNAGGYRLRVELPALWLAPGLYTAYFKFIGSTVTGAQERFFSERAILDITGSVHSIGRASLAPPLNWTFDFESVANRSAVVCQAH